MKKYKLLLLFTVLLLQTTIYAQEFNCNVQVVSPQIQGSNKQVFQTLQTAIYEFMNTRAWTNNIFEMDERIECNIYITISEYDNIDNFKGEIQVQSRRPVYNSSYNTTMFNYRDRDLEFRYIEFEPLEFNPSMHSSNLTSILAYYAYIILGLDYDSFSLLGGTSYYKIAEKIVQNAQNAPEKGWKSIQSTDRRNRYWLINNILDSKYEPVREFIYKYDRQGLDMMSSNPAEARKAIVESLEVLQNMYRNKPDPFMYFYQLMFDARSEEIVKVFSEGFAEEKQRAYKILIEIDPANKNKYDIILTQQST
jgi:hypothetical protein